MPNLEEHVGMSAIAGLFTYLVAKKQMGGAPVTAREVIGVAILSGVTGALPDAIEPPTSPRHRKFFHSGSCLGLLAVANERIARKEEYTPDQKALFAALSMAYGVHLLADSTTPSGLPPI